jgi:hypothetical protein
MAHFVGDASPALYTEKLNLKRPQVGGPNPLHQDYPYWVDGATDATRIATAIVYLDDTVITRVLVTNPARPRPRLPVSC